MQARHTRVKIVYDNSDISSKLAPYLKSFQYKDVLDGEADDISITLEDRAELWEGDWFPSKGSTLKATIIVSDWASEGETELDAGLFEIDEISFSGLPHEVTIKAVSIPRNTELSDIRTNRAWEKVKLSTIAREIADRAGLNLYLNLHSDEEIERLEQNEESDLAFLSKVAKERGCGVKISDSQLDVYYLADLDSADPQATINKISSFISSYSFTSKVHDVYKACHVRYENAKQGVLYESTFTDPAKTEGKTLEIKKQVDSQKEADELAKSELRSKNAEELTGNINFGGMPRIKEDGYSCTTMLVAGITVAIEGFHKLDGKYLIKSSSHSLSNSGYSCSIEVRRCLDGY